MRYVPAVAAAGGRVILECHASLQALFESIAGISKIVTAGPLPFFDVHCPLLSLPLVLGSRFSSIPACPYLTPGPELLDAWKIALGPKQSKLRVGLCWAGGQSDRRRAITLAELHPLWKVNDVQFVSLQKDQSPLPSTGSPIVDFTPQLVDFAQTAALIKQLDLVITVDTAVAHLAGALGTPVWGLLMANADWRWFRDRDDSPWYPSMQLFRQTRMMHWEGAIDRVTRALAELVQA